MSVYSLMNQIQQTSQLNDTPTPDPNSGNGGSGGGGNDADSLLKNFLKLLVTQMQNQDPSNPMDNNQMVSQLAEFATAAGVEKLNTTVGNVGSIVNSLQSMNATNWVGHTVFIEGDSSVSDDGSKEFGFSLSNDCDDVTITYTDKEGNTYTKDLHQVKAGIHKYSIDDDNVQPSPPLDMSKGPFKVSYTAAKKDGSTPSIVSLKSAKVSAVSFSPNGTLLDLGIDGTISLSKVYLVE